MQHLIWVCTGCKGLGQVLQICQKQGKIASVEGDSPCSGPLNEVPENVLILLLFLHNYIVVITEALSTTCFYGEVSNKL